MIEFAASAKSALAENQLPSLCYIPDYSTTTGVEAVEVCKLAGLTLDPWQELTLTHALGELPNHKWAAFEVALVVPRQNGKTLLSIARELVGLFLLGERLIIHSAHQFDTSLEAFRDLCQIIEETPDFDAQVKKISRSHGEEGIELKNGQRLRFRTRRKGGGGGRGFTADCLIMDEAMILDGTMIGNLLPTLSARPNPQVWYCGSAVDEEVHEEGIVLTRLRERAKEAIESSGGSSKESLAFFEFGLPGVDHPDKVSEEVAQDPHSHWRANPSTNIRITPEHMQREQKSMDARTFAVERLGVGAWPDPKDTSLRPISPAMWAACQDKQSEPEDPLGMCFEVSEDRRFAAIGIAGHRSDQLDHLEVVEYREGTNWVVDFVERLLGRHNFIEVVAGATTPAAALVPDFQARGIEVRLLSTSEEAAACGMLYDGVVQQTIRHLGNQEERAAIAGSIRRKLNERWAWSRNDSTVDISPLVSITNALWSLRSGDEGTPEVHSIREVIERKRREAAGESVETEPNESHNDKPADVPAAQGNVWIPL